MVVIIIQQVEVDLLHIPRHQSSRGHKFLIRIHRPIIRLQQLAQQLLRILRQQGLISVEIRWVVHRHLHHSYRNILQQQQPCLLVEMDKAQDQQVRFRRAQAFHHLKYHLVHLIFQARTLLTQPISMIINNHNNIGR